MPRILPALSLVAALLPGLASAEIQRVEAARDVPATMDALQAAVEGAGATVFARVDHAGGAADVGMELSPAQLLIFGNPQLGTPAMQDAIEAGLHLPLRVLVYEDDAGQTWLAYEAPAETLTALDGIEAEADYLSKMAGALEKLTGAAAAP
ncbi:DUF302 domain-containing protein [Pseudoponticoccus marisrubri]|uniref:Camphor resistance protein CrcB n=1 Tax=Pseudoponticoccus marisrubri TaxID=1685382 RepID=A0A0W7WNG9_9RHOB|nr:DUF302 domain-containing protein [Pseudoponticoccus marisrubri]KUF12065.1 camphor resistance protein CrcB [Pseudoponticoccus marisrubri]